MSRSPYIILGIKPSLDIDFDALESNYLVAQLHSHPDKFVGKSPVEKQAAEAINIALNKAYNLLKSRIGRLNAFMQHHGYKINGESSSTISDPELLEETLEWQMSNAQDLENIWSKFCEDLQVKITSESESKKIYTKLCFLNRALNRANEKPLNEIEQKI